MKSDLPQQGKQGISLGSAFYRNAAVAAATILVIALVLNSGVAGSKEKVENKQLDVKAKELQSQLDSLQIEKTKADEGLLQATLEKEQLKAEQAEELAKLGQQAAGARVAQFERARKLKEILSKQWFDPKLLDQARQDYVQWEFFACQYYIGIQVFTSGGNVTVPLACALYNGVYVNSSKFFIDQVYNDSANPVKAALAELAVQYPELKST